MPPLKDTSASGMSPAGNPASASAPAKPKPCSSPNATAIAHGKRRSIVGRSTWRGSGQGEAVPERERRDRLHEQSRGRDEEQQPEDEEEVIGAGEDVLDAERDVAAHHVPGARPRRNGERR